MMLAAIVLVAAGSEPPDAVQLAAPRVQYRANEASATRTPWIDANGWRILRASGRKFVYHAEGAAAALAVAEAFTYGADAAVVTDASGTAPFNAMIEFLRGIPPAELKGVADIGVIDDGKSFTGELMNLLARQNLLFEVRSAPDPKLRVNITGGKGDPNLLAGQIRGQLGDANRSLRIYGTDVVIARLMTNQQRTRVFLLNYSNHSLQGVRVRVRGAFAKSEPHIFGTAEARLEDWFGENGFTEFTIPELGAFAVIDLLR